MAMSPTTYADAFFVKAVDFTALSSFTSEAGLLQGQNVQPTIPRGFLLQPSSAGKLLRVRASGVLSTTGAPTWVFTCRLNTTYGSTNLAGTQIAASPLVTSASGVTNKKWDLELDIVCVTPGGGSSNCSLQVAGRVRSGGGFASPFSYDLEPTTPDTATWTVGVDASVDLYVNLSATCGTNNASNSIQCKKLVAESLN